MNLYVASAVISWPRMYVEDAFNTQDVNETLMQEVDRHRTRTETGKEGHGHGQGQGRKDRDGAQTTDGYI